MQQSHQYYVLPSSELAVGHCVIVNTIDQPCARLVAVVVSVNQGLVAVKYLSASPEFDRYNKGPGMIRRIEDSQDITPLSWFGVEICCNPSGYWCEKIGESKATYEDGTPRLWQDRRRSEKHCARLPLVALCLSAIATVPNT